MCSIYLWLYNVYIAHPANSAQETISGQYGTTGQPGALKSQSVQGSWSESNLTMFTSYEYEEE